MRRVLTMLVATATVLLAACGTLPPPEGRSESRAFTDTDGTRLGRAVAPLAAANPGRTAIHQMPDPRDAFAARVALAGAAERSIDVQYFIWHHDQVGLLLFEALKQAADRGVRVRILLDDAYTQEIEATLASLEAHPSIEVRLYNPFPRGKSRALAWLTDFARLNKRMHNKSFTADNQMTVVGGRNIGDEYFGAGVGINFADIDVLAAGAVVRDVSREFDLYWNSASAYPASAVQRAPEPGHAERLAQAFAANRADPQTRDYLEAVRTTPILRELLERRLAFEWTTATLIYDDPAKTLDASGRTDVLLFPELVRRLGQPQRTLDIVSPYFVPGDQGTASLAAVARRGVKVRILTNALAASDESVVHAGYAHRRADLLRAGVKLYELKPVVERESTEVKGRFGSGSSAGLHAKTYAVDGERIFIGSFNFDQRSARLNTEMGVVLDSAVAAQRLGRTLDDMLDKLAYEVRLAPDGVGLEWIERTAAGERRFDVDPETSWFLRLRVNLLSALPIEWLL